MALRRRAPGGGASPLSTTRGFGSLSLDLNSVLDNIPVQVAPDVHPQLWLGSKHAAFSEVTLLERNITHVLNVSTREPCLYPHQFTYLHIDIRDHSATDILSCLPAASVFIKAGLDSGGVLVHCNGGRSRSASVVIAFLMSTLDMDYDQVLAQLKAARSTISPNKGFEMQLRAFSEAGHNVFGAHQLLLKRRIDAYFGLGARSMSMSQSMDADEPAGSRSAGAGQFARRGSRGASIGAPGDASGSDTPTARGADGSSAAAPALDLRPPRLAMSAPDMPGGFVAITPSRTLHRHIHCNACKQKLLLTVSVMHHSPRPGGRKLIKRGSDSSPRASRGKRARRRRSPRADTGERRASSGANSLSRGATRSTSGADSTARARGGVAPTRSLTSGTATSAPVSTAGQTFETMVVLDTSPSGSSADVLAQVGAQPLGDDPDGPPSAGVGTVEFSFASGLMPRSTVTDSSEDEDSHTSNSSDSSNSGVVMGVDAARCAAEDNVRAQRRRKHRERRASGSRDATSAPIEMFFGPPQTASRTWASPTRRRTYSSDECATVHSSGGAGAGAGAGAAESGLLASPAFAFGGVADTSFGAFGTVVPRGAKVHAPSAPRGRSRGHRLSESAGIAPAHSLGGPLGGSRAVSALGSDQFQAGVSGNVVDVDASSEGSVSVDIEGVAPPAPPSRTRHRWGHSDDRAESSAMVSRATSSRRGLSTFGGSTNSLNIGSPTIATPPALPRTHGSAVTPLRAVWNSTPGLKTPRLAAHSASPLGRPPSPEPAPARVTQLVHINNPRMAHAQFSRDMKLLAGDSHHPALELAAEFASEDAEHAAQLAQCKFIFVEPMPWMGDLTATHRQTIRCKGCSAEIGEYCVEGHRCSCGRAVAGPCIRLSTERLHMSDLGHAGPSVVRANARKPPKLPPTHTVPRHRRQPGRSVSLAT